MRHPHPDGDVVVRCPGSLAERDGRELGVGVRAGGDRGRVGELDLPSDLPCFGNGGGHNSVSAVIAALPSGRPAKGLCEPLKLSYREETSREYTTNYLRAEIGQTLR